MRSITIVDILIFISSAVLFFSLGVVSGAIIRGSQSNFEVGDCVRELGYTQIETVTATSEFGAIETRYPNKYKPGDVWIVTYDKQQQEKLVKVECAK